MNENSEAAAITQTKAWLKDVVLRHNFCPFAHKPFQHDRIHYVVAASDDPRAIVEDLIRELLSLRDADPAVVETTLLITPNCFHAFEDYNDFLDVVDNVIAQLHLEGVIQVASFHPDYQFGDLTADDVRNYTNRSPLPLFHLILEDSIAHARDSHPDVDGIPQTNMDLLEAQGLEATQRQFEACKKS